MEVGKFPMVLACLWLIPGSCWTDGPSKEFCEIPRSTISIPGDATIIGLFDNHKGPNCSDLVTRGLHHMLSAVWTVQELNNQNFIPGVKIGLWAYDTCSTPLLAKKALVKALVERECYSSYSLGVVTIPSISSQLQELVAALHVPEFMTSSEHKYQYPQFIAKFPIVLLSSLNWTQVSIVIAPSSQLLSTFGQMASREDICVRQESTTSNLNNKTWAMMLQTSELWESVQIAVIFGSTDQILDTIHSAQQVNVTSLLQWILVPLDRSQELATSRNLPADSLIVSLQDVIMQEIERNMTELENIATFSYSKRNYKHTYVTSYVVSSPFFFEVASPIINIAHRLKNALTSYCTPKNKSSSTELCGDMPPFYNISSVLVTDNAQIPEGSAKELLSPKIFHNVSYYIVQRVRRIPKHRLEDIGTFLLLDNTTTIFKFVRDDVNISLSVEGYEEVHQCRLHDNSSCKNFCINMVNDKDRNQPKHKTATSWREHLLTLPVTWREEAWVAAIASIAAVGIICSLAISVFILVRICKGDVLEGNPSFSFLLLISINCTYCSILPFSLIAEDPYHRGLICGLRIFGTSVSYALLFSIMLSRSFMLASCDQEGGFMSHVNGYLQTVLCFFIAGVQLALSVQFWAINSALLGSHQCSSIYEGHLFLLLLSYDMFLLLLLVCTSPFIAKSKRNYQEGIFFTVASILCLLIFIGWCTAYLIVPRKWQDAAITGGLTATATAILVTVFIPRTYLMMTAIVRDHLASALPSLAYTSTTSIQDVNYRSTQVLYDTVAPHPIIHPPETTGQVNPNFYSDQPQSPVVSGPATSAAKPISQRGFGERRSISPENTYERYDTPPSPQKVTRF